jgi:hypothetical protein
MARTGWTVRKGLMQRRRRLIPRLACPARKGRVAMAGTAAMAEMAPTAGMVRRARRFTCGYGSSPLLQAKVSGAGRDLYYLIDPTGGTLKVSADGGAGGAGGSGGRAGRGGLGGFGNPSGFNGLDGRPGFDGRAGSPGAPGTITVSIDPTAQPYEHLLVLSNHSGSGQAGPAPTIVIEPVPPLW